MSVASFPSSPPRRDPYRFGDADQPVLIPGTLGWSADDLRDPVIRALWDHGRYEIIEGVLTAMPPAFFLGGNVAENVVFLLRMHLFAKHVPCAFAPEADIELSREQIVRCDFAGVIGDDLKRFNELKFEDPKITWRQHNLTLPPTIVIESISQGHERHDEVSKRKWYAEFGIPNYWIVNGFRRTLECLRLVDGAYQVDARGEQSAIVSPSAFAGLNIELMEVWGV